MLLTLLLAFVTQMGDLSFVRTQEDRDRLNFYERQYEAFVPGGEIPKILHFIWVGGAALPREAKKNIAAWSKLHPDWQVKLWSDRARSLPQVQVVLLDDLPHLGRFFAASDNEGERAALARYEILYREGGVYLDCDCTPKKSLDQLNGTHTFYTGLAPLNSSLLSSSVQIAPHILAAKAQHPILKETMALIEKRWDPTRFLGQDFDAIYYRTTHHTLLPLQEAIEAHLGKSDRIYPAQTFQSIYLEHEERKLWLPDEERFAKSVLQKLFALERRGRWLIGLIAFLMVIQIIFLVRNGRKAAH